MDPLVALVTELTSLITSDLGFWRDTTEKSIRVDPCTPILESTGLTCVVRRLYNSDPYRSGNLVIHGNATFRVSLVQYDPDNVTSLISAFEKIQKSFNVVNSHYQSDSSNQFFEQSYQNILSPFSDTLN